MDNMLFYNTWLTSPVSCACLQTRLSDNGKPCDIRIKQANYALAAMTGTSVENMSGKSLNEVFPDITADSFDLLCGLSSFDDEVVKCTKFYSNKLGGVLEITLYAMSTDEYLAVIFKLPSPYIPDGDTSFSDIYPQLNSQLFNAIVSSVSDGIIASDENGQIVFMNKIASEMTEWDAQNAIGMHINNVFNTLDYKSRDKHACPVTMVKTTGQPFSPSNDSVLVSHLGLEKIITYTAAPVYGSDNTITGYVLTFKDITLEKHKLEAIEFLSYHDVLTGLYNRTFFEAELKRLDTPRNYPLTMVIADLNSLKLTNDAFGHAQGDCLLRKAGEVLKLCCRADDIIARTGGDEFILLLPKTDGEDAKKIVERIKELCKQTTVCSIDLSISFGWESKVYKNENIRDIQKRAENNMYRQKLFESSSVKGNTVKSIITTLYGAHTHEEEHSKNVSRICELIGKELGMNENKIRFLVTASLMHDIGKIAIDNEIEKKLDPLTVEDWMDIKRHPEIGYRILSSVNDMAEIADCVLSHHERWDGKGYPRGLSGENIPLCSRIIAIADAYDAMTSNRAFRHNMSSDAAMQEIKRNAGTQFDPKLAELFGNIYIKNNETLCTCTDEGIIETLLHI